MIHFAAFTTGGFVLHKITPESGKGRISAWYDKDGNLLDSEHIDKLGRSRSINKGSRQEDILKTLGLRYVKRGV